MLRYLILPLLIAHSHDGVETYRAVALNVWQQVELCEIQSLDLAILGCEQRRRALSIDAELLRVEIAEEQVLGTLHADKLTIGVVTFVCSAPKG